MSDEQVTGRLAPSPTGALHLGHALSFLAAFWSARSQGGSVILRLEDVDAERASPEHMKQTIEDLSWLGLSWDGEPLVQSTRVTRLREAALGLLESGRAYPCVCTRKELARSGAGEEPSGAPHGQGPRYTGTCQGRYPSLEQAEKESGREAGLRFRADAKSTVFEDAVFGKIEENVAETVGDFLILRRNKVPAYQLAVVVDDDMDGVTEVVRGRDLLSSTARQIEVARALGVSPPHYAHVPLICDAEGQRLAKRDAARGLGELRAQGVTAERIRSWAARCLGQDASPSGLATSHFSWSEVPQEDILLPTDLSQVL